MRKRDRDVSGSSDRPRRSCPRAVKVVAGLLALQALGYVGIGLFCVTMLYVVPNISNEWAAYLISGSLASLAKVLERLLAFGQSGSSLLVLFLPLGLLGFVAAIGLCRLRQVAWMIAMTVQGICLLIALVLYFTAKPEYVYLILGYGVFMVLYLNYSEVADAFRLDSVQIGKGQAQ